MVLDRDRVVKTVEAPPWAWLSVCEELVVGWRDQKFNIDKVGNQDRINGEDAYAYLVARFRVKGFHLGTWKGPLPHSVVLHIMVVLH